MNSKLLLALLLAIGLLRSATAFEAVTIGESMGAKQPQIAIDAGGRVHLTFGADGSIYYTSSSDRGASFAEPTLVARQKSLALGMRRGPRIAVAKDAIAITAIGGSQGGGRDGDVLAWRSLDNGKSWQRAIKVNDVAASAREGLHAMAAGPRGDLYCAWLDLRNKRTQLFGSRSTDGGATWSANALIYESPDGSICECCHPSVVFDRRGTLHVLWRNSLDGDRDMYWASSADGGRTFSKAARLGQVSWPLDACPMDGGAIAIGPDHRPATVWRRGQEVFLTTNNASQEQKLGRGLQPWLAGNDHGLYAVWIGARPGDLYVLSLGSQEPTRLAGNARDPAVAAAPGGPVVVAWETDENGRAVVKVKAILHNRVQTH